MKPLQPQHDLLELLYAYGNVTRDECLLQVKLREYCLAVLHDLRRRELVAILDQDVGMPIPLPPWKRDVLRRGQLPELAPAITMVRTDAANAEWAHEYDRRHG